jgi:D-glycero-alpha-D-manno-heptose-7-phosphate kinase
MTSVFRARAPVRFCDLGGWTDTRLVERGCVLNFAATLYTHVTIEVGGEAGLTLESADTAERATASNLRQLEYNNVLDLCKAALRRMGVDRDLRLTVRSDVPPGSGLGSSAALGVATLAALSRALDRPCLPYELAREAQALEVQELGLECGVQDQLAAAYGGICFMDVEYPEARVLPMVLEPSTLYELEERLLIVYTGKSHFSSEMHHKVIGAMESGEPQVRAAFETLAACAREGKQALLAGDLERFAGAMSVNWEAQKSLHPEITTDAVEELAAHTRGAGALGFKLNGAGGGGTATMLCARNRLHLVAREVETLGMRVLPARIDFDGLRTWQAA